MKFEIVISPPKLDCMEMISKKFKGNKYQLFDTDYFLSTPLSDLKSDIQNHEKIIIYGPNSSLFIRRQIEERIEKIYFDYEIEYLFFDIKKSDHLYNLYKSDDFKDILPTYIYFDYLDLSNIDKSKLTTIDLKTDLWNDLKNGKKAMIVNIKSFYVGLAKYRINLDIPRELKSVKFNSRLKKYLKYMNKNGYDVFISYCSDHQYNHVDGDHLINMINHIKNNMDFAISGTSIDWVDNTFTRNKPNPWHLFQMIDDFGLDAEGSHYIGYDSNDEIFSNNAGIGNFVNCNNAKLMEGLAKVSDYIL